MQAVNLPDLIVNEEYSKEKIERNRKIFSSIAEDVFKDAGKLVSKLGQHNDYIENSWKFQKRISTE